MWRLQMDEEVQLIEENRMKTFKDRINPFEEIRDDEFKARYRFPKGILTELLDIVAPALERDTQR